MLFRGRTRATLQECKAVLAEAEVLETASRLGEDIWFPFVGMDVGIVGLMSGEGAEVGDSGDDANSFVRPPFLMMGTLATRPFSKRGQQTKERRGRVTSKTGAER